MSLAPSRNTGPLGEIQIKGDALKVKINELTGMTSKWSNKTAADEQVQECHRNCVEYQGEVNELLKQAKLLELHNEPNLSSNFDQKKNDEIKRLQNFEQKLTQLIDLIEKLPNSLPLKLSREKSLKQDDGEDDDEEDQESSNEGDYDDELNENDLEADFYEVINNFTAEQKGDLTIKANEIVDVLIKHENGWWEAENVHGDRGLVPSNFLKPHTEEDEEEEVRESEEEEEESEEPKQEEETEEAKSSKPSLESDDKPVRKMSSGKELWKSIRESVTAPTKLDVTDVLSAMGALPSGFRPSLLHSSQQNTDRFSLRHAILPRVTESKLGYRDLYWDSANQKVLPMVTRVLRGCKILKCTQIPLPGTGVEVLSRHIRYALFDGSKIISNIVTVRAQYNPAEPKLWHFSPAKAKDGIIIPSLLNGNITVRTDTMHSQVSILFELGVTYVRNQTGEKGELSCGWSRLMLFDKEGNRAKNGSKIELPVNGGTPFEQDVELDPSIHRRATNNRFLALIAANKEPKLFVRLYDPTPARKKYLDDLPLTIVFPSALGHMLALFRSVLAEALVHSRSNPSDASLLHVPVIATFLAAADQVDIMDVMLRNWTEKEKLMTKPEKRDQVYQVQIFKSVVMETAYPLLHINSLPERKWANMQAEEARYRFVNTLALATRQPKGAIKHFLTSNVEMEPFDIAELTFDPLINAARKLA